MGAVARISYVISTVYTDTLAGREQDIQGTIQSCRLALHDYIPGWLEGVCFPNRRSSPTHDSMCVCVYVCV